MALRFRPYYFSLEAGDPVPKIRCCMYCFFILSLILIRERQSTAEVRKPDNLKRYEPTSASDRSIFIIYSLVFFLLSTFLETQIRSLKITRTFILHPRVITTKGREGGSRAQRLSLVSMYCKLFSSLIAGEDLGRFKVDH